MNTAGKWFNQINLTSENTEDTESDIVPQMDTDKRKFDAQHKEKLTTEDTEDTD